MALAINKAFYVIACVVCDPENESIVLDDLLGGIGDHLWRNFESHFKGSSFLDVLSLLLPAPI